MLKDRPAVMFSLPFIAGILVGWQWNFSTIDTLAFCAAIFGLCVVFVLVEWESTKSAVSPLLMLLVFGTGMLKISVDKNPPEKRQLEHFFASPSQRIIRGTVTDPPRRHSERIQFVVDAEAVVNGMTQVPLGSVLVSTRLDSGSQWLCESLQYGSVVEFLATLAHPGAARNPAEFDLRYYLSLHGIYGRAYLDDPASVSVMGNDGNWFLSEIIFPLRRDISRHLDLLIGDDEARFLKGLIIGDRSEIPFEVKTSFINAGVMHILAVSGLHVGLVSIMLFVVLVALRIPETPRTFLLMFLLIFYAFLTGLSPSVVRAVIMACVILGAQLFDRRADILNSLAMAALVILYIDARQLMMPGFQLSFAAVFSIALLFPRLYEFGKAIYPRLATNRIMNGATNLMCLSLAAGIGTLPFTALYFAKIPLVGFLANVVIVPWSGVVLAVGMTTVFFSFISHQLASLYAEAARACTTILLDSVQFFGNLSFAYLDARPSHVEAVLFYGILAAWVNLGWFTLKRTVMFALVILNVVFYGWMFGFLAYGDRLRVTFLDVGQGDAIVIRFPDGKTMLVDAGPRTFVSNAGERFVVPYLKAHGVDRLDALLVTHPHSDHLGGVTAVLRSIPVRRVLDAGSVAGSSILDEYLRLVDSLRIPRDIIRAGTVLGDFEDSRLYVLYPMSVDSLGKGNLNNESIVIQLVHGSTSLLLAGDVEEAAERAMVRGYSGFLKSGVLKAGHHGSSTSSSLEFLATVRPLWTIVSVGKNNKFGHPSPEVVQRFEDHGIAVYRTDEHNAIVLVSDGNSWREERWR